MSVEVDFRCEDGGLIKRLLWATDLHLDASSKTQYRLFFELFAAHDPDSILIGGDISNGIASFSHLQQLYKFIRKPIYFVLGNHDFYYGSITKTRALAHKLSDEQPEIHYLTDGGVVPLSAKTALIGHDGWSDARVGDFLNSPVMLNDYFLIEELKNIKPEERLYKLNQLGLEAADYAYNQLTIAFEKYERVILLTHVPPFEESCLYEGLPSNPEWSPHFVGQAMGEALEDLMSRYPLKQLLVLCGHSHWGQDIHILPNLRVITGHSEVGIPSIQGVIFAN
jgi:3',5'-cyclic-AMP phosphodiesterase